MDHSVRLFGLQHTHTTYRANLPSVHLDVCGTVPAAPGLVFPAGLRQSLPSVYCYSRGSLPIDMDSLHHRKNSSGLHHVLEVMPKGRKWILKKWIQLQDCDERGGVGGQMYAMYEYSLLQKEALPSTTATAAKMSLLK